MSDFRLSWDAAVGAADLSITANDLTQDGGLETAVYLSLFTDRRAEDSDALPDGQTDRRGWWGDAFATVSGDRWGSRLWLLARSKSTPEVLRRAEEYAREALAWLLEDKVAGAVSARAEPLGDDGAALHVEIHRPTGDVVKYRYDYVWASQEARRAS